MLQFPEGRFTIADKTYSVTPGHALIITPETGYSYGNAFGEYMDDWLHFMPTDTKAFLQSYPMINEPFPIGNTDTFTFFIKQALWDATYASSEYSLQNVDALLTVLFNHLAVAYKERHSLQFTNPFRKQLLEIRLNLQNDFASSRTLSEYAKMLGVSKSYFQHLYTELFGTSFQQDVIQLRVEHARYLLTTTNLTLDQVAEACGYNNEVHFYRQFKQLTSITPAQYRKRNISS